MPRRKRTAGSSSDATGDSDDSVEQEKTDSSHSDGNSRANTRLTRASSLRLSQSSHVCGDCALLSGNLLISGTASLSARPPLPLRIWSSLPTDRAPADVKHVVDRDESPPRTPTGNAASSESDIDVSSPNASHDESHARDPSQKDSASDPSHRPKRRRFHESYNFNMKCPTPGCNSLGNLLIFLSHERHFAISGCPLYHNLSADECKVKAVDRDKQEEERSQGQTEDHRHATRHQAPTPRQVRYKEKVVEMRKRRNSPLPREQKDKSMEHRQSHGTSREPLLDNVTSEYDLELFRKAQARASEDLEKLRLQGQITEGSNMIKTILFGRYELDTLYHSPYPEEYARLGRLYVCEFCLKYMKSQTILRRHMVRKLKNPFQTWKTLFHVFLHGLFSSPIHCKESSSKVRFVFFSQPPQVS
uniref:Histone acetyltransferase n=1 Tax=Denticeps clupeoides TaxID=299321 RepID=A0AAY4C4B8_9TELE